MFAGVGQDEILNCLKSRDAVSTGWVWHAGTDDGRKLRVCQLVSTDKWVREMNGHGSKTEGRLQITWAVGDNLMFTLEFPRRALKTYRDDGSRRARVRVAATSLTIRHGSLTKLIHLSACPGYIDFGESLDVIPFTLYQAAASYIAANPDPESNVA